MKSVVLFISLISAFAANSACLTPKQVQAVDAVVEISSDQAMDLCDVKSTAFRVYNTIEFLQKIGTLPSETKEFGKGIIGQLPIEFFKKRVKKIQISSKPDCEGVANVGVGQRGSQSINVCPLAAYFAPLELSSVLLHEARHLDGPQYGHRKCYGGPNAGKFSCDPSYAHGGAYAVSAEFLIKVHNSSHISSTIRKKARRQAIRALVTRFNTLPLDLVEGALFIRDKSAFFYDGKKLTELPIVPGSIPVLRGGILTFFNIGGVESYFFDGKNLFQKASADLLNLHFDASTDQGEIIDVVYASEYVCFLKIHSLKCSGIDGRFFEKKFNFTAKRFIYSQFRIPFIVPKSVNVVSDNNELYTLPARLNEIKTLDSSLWRKSRNPFPIISVGRWNGRETFAIDQKQTVRLYNRKDRKWKVPAALIGEKFEWVISPFIWSKKMHDL